MVAAEEDFARYSNEELVQKRTQVGEMSEAERERFRTEMQQRTRAITPEERGTGELQRERQRAHSVDGYGQGYGQREPRQARGLSLNLAAAA